MSDSYEKVIQNVKGQIQCQFSDLYCTQGSPDRITSLIISSHPQFLKKTNKTIGGFFQSLDKGKSKRPVKHLAGGAVTDLGEGSVNLSEPFI